MPPLDKDELIREFAQNLGRDAKLLREYFTDSYMRFRKWDRSGGYSCDDLEKVIEFFTGYPGRRASIGDFSKDPLRAEALCGLNFAHVTATDILEKEAVKHGLDPYRFHKRAELTREICNREPWPVYIDVGKLSKEDQLVFSKNDADIVRLKAYLEAEKISKQNIPSEPPPKNVFADRKTGILQQLQLPAGTNPKNIPFTEELTSLDDIDKKIILLYQEAEKQAANNPKSKIKMPGSRKIAKAIFKAEITDKEYSHTAIDKRRKKLRDMGLIGHPDDNKDKANSFTPEHIDDMGGQIKQTF